MRKQGTTLIYSNIILWNNVQHTSLGQGTCPRVSSLIFSIPTTLHERFSANVPNRGSRVENSFLVFPHKLFLLACTNLAMALTFSAIDGSSSAAWWYKSASGPLEISSLETKFSKLENNRSALPAAASKQINAFLHAIIGSSISVPLIIHSFWSLTSLTSLHNEFFWTKHSLWDSVWLELSKPWGGLLVSCNEHQWQQNPIMMIHSHFMATITKASQFPVLNEIKDSGLFKFPLVPIWILN